MGSRWLVVIVACVLAAVAAGMMAARKRPATATKPADPVVIPDGHDWFGEVWLTNNFAWSFPVANYSNRPVTVRHVTGSCTCLSVNPTGFTLDPGQTQVINARFDFTVKPLKDENAAFVLSYEFADRPEGPYREGRWLLSGKVRPLLTLSQPLHFGRHSVLAQPLKPLSVVGQTGTIFDAVTADATGPWFRTEVTRDRNAEGFRLVLSPFELLPVGRVESSVLLTIKLPSGELRTERIPVMGQIVPDVEPSPPGYPGGGRLVGEAFEFDVTLASATRKPFAVVGVESVGEGLMVALADDRYVVRQICTAEGVQTGRVDFEVDAADGRYTTSVAVNYLGFRP